MSNGLPPMEDRLLRATALGQAGRRGRSALPALTSVVDGKLDSRLKASTTSSREGTFEGSVVTKE